MKTTYQRAFSIIATIFITLSAYPKNYVLFSPEDKPAKKLIEFIDTAKKSIHAAVYFLTDKDIASHLISAKQRGIDVQIVMDVISTDSSFGKGSILALSNIPIHTFIVPGTGKHNTQDQRFSYLPIMHHKFAIFDDTILWTGSFNWTVAANNKNCENVIYTDDPETCKKYKNYWTSLVTQKCRRYLPQQNSPRWRSVKPLHSNRQTAQRIRTRTHMVKA